MGNDLLLNREQQRVKNSELEKREQYLIQEAEKIENWKRKLSFDEQADERRKVELAMDFAVRSNPGAAPSTLIDTTKLFLSELDQIVTDRLAAKEVGQSEV